jgi:type IV pilus assembly protein PilC
MAKHPDVFPKLYISVIKSGEESGKLDQVLLNLAEQMEKDYELISKLKSAMTYPAVIFVTLIAVAVLIMIFVMPQLEKVFNDTGVSLPVMTKILLLMSRTLSKYWWAFAIAAAGFVIFMAKFIKTKLGSQIFDLVKIKTPILKGIFVKIYSARFARTSHTLISSGVAINEIFDTVGQVINNSYYAKDLEKISEKIKSGKPLSMSLEQTHRFPHLMSSLVKVGEKSGKIDYVLGTLADYFEREVDRATANLSALIEPVIMLVLGVGVGLVIVSVLMPIYGLVNTI